MVILSSFKFAMRNECDLSIYYQSVTGGFLHVLNSF